MEAMILAGGCLYVCALGFLVVGRLDRFLGSGGLRPYWDEAAEQNELEMRPDDGWKPD